MQCQAKLEPWETPPGQLIVMGDVRCPNRATATIENRWVCRQHLAAALRRLRGEPDPRAIWWEIEQAEAQGRCPFCGAGLDRLPASPLAPAATPAYRPCANPICAEQRSAARRAALEDWAFLSGQTESPR